MSVNASQNLRSWKGGRRLMTAQGGGGWGKKERQALLRRAKVEVDVNCSFATARVSASPHLDRMRSVPTMLRQHLFLVAATREREI